MQKRKQGKEATPSQDLSPWHFPSPHDISDLPVAEPHDIIRYSLIYPLRRNNNVAEIIVNPYPDAQLHRVLKEPCEHKYVSRWKCEACDQSFFNFRHFLDLGQHTKFVAISHAEKIKVETEATPFVFKTKIYSAYQPADVVELREYMMLVLSRSMGQFDSRLSADEPRLSRKLSYYLATRYDNWAFYSHRCRPERILKFNAMFESGNLEAAELVDPTHYLLTLVPDTNAGDYAQWFYFSASNAVAGKRVNFKIINLVHGSTLYGKGMHLWVYSREKHGRANAGWQPGGEGVYYYENSYPRRGKRANYFTLSFDHTFEFADDEVFFAYGHPYTYTRTCYLIHRLEVFCCFSFT